MDLSTTYMGLRLAHPFVAGASPLSATVEGARRLEDGGAAAIILPSLFEEGVIGGRIAVRSFYEEHDYPLHPETLPAATALGLSPDAYLTHLSRVRKAIRVPVFASLNGSAVGAWTQNARIMEREGADAIELNLYTLPTEAVDPGDAIERRLLDLVSSVKADLRIPLAVKISPFYTSIPHFVRKLVQAGADGIVIFNRFYQADIDLEKMDLVRTLVLSTSADLLLRLRWLAALHGRIPASLAVTGGVHTAEDALKAVLSGAQVVQVVSALLEGGPERLGALRQDTEAWLAGHQIDALEGLRGKLSLLRAPGPKAYERMNYIYNLDSWYGPIPAPSHPVPEG